MEELEELGCQEEYEVELLLAYSQLKEMEKDKNEPLCFFDKTSKQSISHTKEWKKNFESIYMITIMVAERLWPEKVGKPKNKSDEQNLSSINNDEKKHNTDYEIPNYDSLILNVIRSYKPLDANGVEQRFWNYYIFCLRRFVFKNYAEKKINKIHKLTKRERETFRKALTAWHKVDHRIPDFYSNEAKAYLLEKGIFPSEKELNLFYLTLYNSIRIHNDDDDHTLLSITEESSIFSNVDLEDSLQFLEDCYLKKMALKKQNENAQIIKEIFYKEIITYYAISNAFKTNPTISPDDIYEMVRTKKFASKRIINEYKIWDQSLSEFITKDKHHIVRLNREPVSYESISIYNGKEKGYGSKRMKDFLSFCDSCKENKPDETKDISKEQIESELETLELRYEKFINQKVQNKEDQEKKEKFSKEIITLLIAETFHKTYKNLEYNDIRDFMKGRKFTSEDVLDSLCNNEEVTFKSISQKYKKQDNYGSKVKNRFLNL